ncbi:hypothetical protein PUN28_018017 [Cardiocondyla obscurior]|uniref:Uncharacterized protein n=1 Tax=Cardiocondyla obscurior TaxID=286306 RepID=A0AAW2EFF6_9HYME
MPRAFSYRYKYIKMRKLPVNCMETSYHARTCCICDALEVFGNDEGILAESAASYGSSSQGRKLFFLFRRPADYARAFERY